MMDRRRFLLTSLGGAFVAPFAAKAQPAAHQDHEFGLLSSDAVALGSAETTNCIGPFS